MLPGLVPSYYGKEVLGDISGNGGRGVGGGGNTQPVSDNRDDSAAKAQGRKDKDSQPILDRLLCVSMLFQVLKRIGYLVGACARLREAGLCAGEEDLHPSKEDRYEARRERDCAEGPTGETWEYWRESHPRGDPRRGEWSIWEVDGEKDVVRQERWILKLHVRPANGQFCR